MGTDQQQSGVSRRDLMKKGAVAGGIAWSAPILLSASDVAGAQTGAGSPTNCTTWYYGKFEANDDAPDPFIKPGSCDVGSGAGASQLCYSEGQPGHVEGRSYVSGCGTAYDPDGPRTLVLDARLNKTGALIQNVSGFTKTTDDLCIPAQVDKLDNGNWRLTFFMSDTGGFSNVQFSFCA